MCVCVCVCVCVLSGFGIKLARKVDMPENADQLYIYLTHSMFLSISLLTSVYITLSYSVFFFYPIPSISNYESLSFAISIYPFIECMKDGFRSFAKAIFFQFPLEQGVLSWSINTQTSE